MLRSAVRHLPLVSILTSFALVAGCFLIAQEHADAIDRGVGNASYFLGVLAAATPRFREEFPWNLTFPPVLAGPELLAIGQTLFTVAMIAAFGFRYTWGIWGITLIFYVFLLSLPKRHTRHG
jgi:xanthine/uracil permease